MPKLVKPKMVKISARAWRAVRSFLESSLKDEYSWNIGVLTDNTATFAKPGKWLLFTYADNGVPTRELFTADFVALVKIRGTKVVIGLDIATFDLNAPDLHTYYLVPDVNIPFAYPISLKDIIDKMFKYPVP